MAHIQMLLQNYVGQDDDQGDDDDYNYYESSMIELETTDSLRPLEKLHKYCTSENIFTRQMVARSIVETVQSLTTEQHSTTEQECLSLLEIVKKLADDIEPSVRCELIEHLPSCSIFIMDLNIIPDAISTFILPVMVRYLTDPNNQVRKLSHHALLQLLSQDLIKKEDVELQICPVIFILTEDESDKDFRTEAVALMTKIACLLGTELTQKLFLEKFAKLCCDASFHVRKACASHFGEIATVLKKDTTEKHLLQYFAHLCRDGLGGVRKACAESFMAVSNICSREVCYHMMSPLFVGLLADKSRWVQMQAYQVLGQFVSTFDKPQNLDEFPDSLLGIFPVKAGGLGFPNLNNMQNSNILPVLSLEDTSLSFNAFAFWRLPLPNVDLTEEVVDKTDSCNEEMPLQNEMLDTSDTSSNNDELTIPGEAVKTYVIIDSTAVVNLNDQNTENNSIVENMEQQNNHGEEIFSSENVLIQKDDEKSMCIENKPYESTNETLEATTISPIDSDSDSESYSYLEYLSTNKNGEEENTAPQTPHYSTFLISNKIFHCQKIIPPALLEHFISMTEPSKTNNIDGDLPFYCAFTLPGVVLALGRENWHLLRDTYIHLSNDMQWKVRRTLAFSIHDLALILGQKICVEDLVPVFNRFLKDLDEVRVGVLQHLFEFISILSKEQQKYYLPIFSEFQNSENTRNWRFRKNLSEQLIYLVRLYTEEEISEYLCPIALQLASDRIAEVREYSFGLLLILLQRLYKYNDLQLLNKFVAMIISLGYNYQHWVKRKACVQIYLKLLETTWYNKSHFIQDFLSSLLNLCTDVVANIRLISAKAISALVRSPYYQSLPEADEVRKHVESTVENLQTDSDKDVRYFSGGKIDVVKNMLICNDDTIPYDLNEDM